MLNLLLLSQDVMSHGVGYDSLYQKSILQNKCNVFIIHTGKYHSPKRNIFSIKDKNYVNSYKLIKNLYINKNIDIAHVKGFLSFEHLYLYSLLIFLNKKFVITLYSHLTKHCLNNKLFFENPDIKKLNLKNNKSKPSINIQNYTSSFFKKLYVYSFGLFIIKRAKTLICFSKFERQTAYKFKKNIEILYEPSLITKTKKVKVKKFNYFNKKDINIVYWGRLDFRIKGIDRIITFAKNISKIDKKNIIKIYLMGPDYNQGLNKANNLIIKFNLQKKVIVAPTEIWKQTKTPLIHADYSILLSRWDGFPRSLRESLFFNVPVIVSKETNFADLINNFKCGLVINADKKDYLKFIKLMLSNKHTIKNHKNNCNKAFNEIHPKNTSTNFLKILSKYSHSPKKINYFS
jgi:glycosyltransferase involved in cell wall biosynthesis